MSNQTTNIQYPLNNDLMFGLVMQNQVLCKRSSGTYPSRKEDSRIESL